MKLASAAVCLALVAPLAAQQPAAAAAADESAHLPFVATAAAAFAQARQLGRRVLVYQDWPT